jgi:DNA-binding MarR family transcriptional regulator
MTHHTSDVTHLMPLVRHAMAHFGVEQTSTGRELGLTNARMMALAVVDSTGACSMSQLARELDLPSPLATRVANELVTRGLVAREADSSDRRLVLLRTTDRGRAVLETVHHEAEELVSSVLSRMSEAETQALLLGLRSFLRVMHSPADDGTATIPPHGHGFLTGAES